MANKVPITRNNKFFSQEDYELQLEYLREYIEEDANQTVILYQVDYNVIHIPIYIQRAPPGSRC